MAETRNDAEAAFEAFVETYALKYGKAVEYHGVSRNCSSILRISTRFNVTCSPVPS